MEIDIGSSPTIQNTKMKYKTNIIQYDCRVLKANYEKIQKHIAESLQETMLKENSNITFKGYQTYNNTSTISANNRPTGGTSILVKNNIPPRGAKTTAVRATILHSIYIPPHPPKNKWK